jgi:hypothetical protein
MIRVGSFVGGATNESAVNPHSRGGNISGTTMEFAAPQEKGASCQEKEYEVPRLQVIGPPDRRLRTILYYTV